MSKNKAAKNVEKLELLTLGECKEYDVNKLLWGSEKGLQVRPKISDAHIVELRASIVQFGQDTPVELVKLENGELLVIKGNTRCTAIALENRDRQDEKKKKIQGEPLKVKGQLWKTNRLVNLKNPLDKAYLSQIQIISNVHAGMTKTDKLPFLLMYYGINPDASGYAAIGATLGLSNAYACNVHLACKQLGLKRIQEYLDAGMSINGLIKVATMRRDVPEYIKDYKQDVSEYTRLSKFRRDDLDKDAQEFLAEYDADSYSAAITHLQNLESKINGYLEKDAIESLDKLSKTWKADFEVEYCGGTRKPQAKKDKADKTSKDAESQIRQGLIALFRERNITLRESDIDKFNQWLLGFACAQYTAKEGKRLWDR